MNIIVNGASRGIGLEVARYLANNKDNHVLATGRNEDALKTLESEFPGGNLSYMKMDLSMLDQETGVIKDQIYNRFSRVDILINMAGDLTVKDFMKMTREEERRMMDINFFGPAGFIRIVIPIMAPGSHIVNISSMGGFQGSSKYRGLSVYSASKAALACLSECLALELAAEGISVNCLALGSVQTEMFENAFPGFKAPLTPAEMAEFISYFAVSGNKYFNGKVLPVAVNNP